jgi:predicted nucleic acid-binding protein
VGSTVSLSTFRTSQVPFAADGAAFVAEHISASRLVGTNRLLVVDRSSLQVLDYETGMTLASAGLGALAAKLRALRAPSWLREEDAARVALQVPEVAARVGPGCRLAWCFPDEEAPKAENISERKHGLTAYDAAYLELAMRHRIALATADGALERAARAEGIEIV